MKSKNGQRAAGTGEPKRARRHRRKCSSCGRPLRSPPGESARICGHRLRLIIDWNNPGQITVDGWPVSIQRKQFLLCDLLARFAGCCVPNERIYITLFGDSVVEKAQIGFQTSKLRAAIREATDDGDDLIRTIRGHGLLLDLSPQQILIIQNRAS
jgi:DNA-binding response OmpR family regulator